MTYDLYVSYTTKINDTEEKTIRHSHKKLQRQDAFDKASELFKDIPEDAVGLYVSIDENWDSKMAISDI